MTTNRQFALGVHLLTMLAGADGDALNSEAMARSACANAVSIRRALARFRNAGWVRSRPGAGGGSELTRDPARITLADVWDVLYGHEALLGTYAGDPDCPVGARMEPLLLAVDARARRAVHDALDATTIADLVRDLPSVPAALRAV